MLEVWLFTLALNIPSWGCGDLDQSAYPTCGEIKAVFAIQTEAGCKKVRRLLGKELAGYSIQYELTECERGK